MNIKKLIIMMLALFCAGVAFGQQKVAVYVTGDVDASFKKVIGARMVSAITQDNEYAAVERTAEFLNELNKEQSYQRTGFVDDQQIVELGKQFGVDFVCVADVSKVFESYFVYARMINVKTGLIVATAEIDKEIKGMTDLNEISENVANGLINNTKGCNGKDRSTDKKGCCEGLEAIDGICRDVSGDMYWIDWKAEGISAAVKAQTQAGVYWEKIKIPAGYRLPTINEAKILYTFFKQPLWTNESYINIGYDNDRDVRTLWDKHHKITQYGYREYNSRTDYYVIYIYDGIKAKTGFRSMYTTTNGRDYNFHSGAPSSTVRSITTPEESTPALAVFLRK